MADRFDEMARRYFEEMTESTVYFEDQLAALLRRVHDEAQVDAAAQVADTLKLTLSPGWNPIASVQYDIRRLLDTERKWGEACELAREHCPAPLGRSHIRDGIPALARAHAAARKVVEAAREYRDECDQKCACVFTARLLAALDEADKAVVG